MFFDGHIINLVIISNWGNIKNLLITRFIEFIPVYFVYRKIFTISGLFSDKNRE